MKCETCGKELIPYKYGYVLKRVIFTEDGDYDSDEDISVYCEDCAP